MKEDEDSQEAENVRRICEVLQQSGAEALDGATPDDVARRWIAAGIDDAEDVADWLRARCFSPEGALALERAGVTPEQAALLTRAGASADEETIACKIARGDLTLEEARRIITNDFWNT
jgi:phosphohistidine phosphatase SixA